MLRPRQVQPWLLALLVLLLWMTGCKSVRSVVEVLPGRWEVVGNQNLTVPESFFWFSMAYLEFRDEGTLLALIRWPQDKDGEIRVNQQARYQLVGPDQIAIVGGCRHQDPCTGTYTLQLQGDTLILAKERAELELRRVGPPSPDPAPTIIGPSASPVP